MLTHTYGDEGSTTPVTTGLSQLVRRYPLAAFPRSDLRPVVGLMDPTRHLSGRRPWTTCIHRPSHRLNIPSAVAIVLTAIGLGRPPLASSSANS